MKPSNSRGKARGRQPKVRWVRTCPLCGNKFDEALYPHLLDEHENDFKAVASHLSRALHRALNRRAGAR